METFVFETPIGSLFLMADNEALLRLDFMDREHECPKGLPRNTTYETMLAQIAKTENYVLKQSITELASYFCKKLKIFTIPLSLNHCGTVFQQKCWQALTQIPYGEIRTYKDMAKTVGSPRAFRAVGGANHNNPIAIIVPCHRVLGANKKMVGFGGGLWRKAWLLELECQSDPLFKDFY